MLHHWNGAGSELKDSYLQASGRRGLHILSSRAMDGWRCTRKPSSRTVRFSRTPGKLREILGPILAWSKVWTNQQWSMSTEAELVRSWRQGHANKKSPKTVSRCPIRICHFLNPNSVRTGRMSWRCGLGTQVVFSVASHTTFLSSFFRFDVLV
jgi:hypothetical protein